MYVWFVKTQSRGKISVSENNENRNVRSRSHIFRAGYLLYHLTSNLLDVPAVGTLTRRSGLVVARADSEYLFGYLKHA